MGAASSQQDSPLRGAMSYPHDERMRKTGRRKLVLRKKAHSYPSSNATPTPYSPTPVQRLEQIQPSRHDEHSVSPKLRQRAAAVRDFAAVSAQNSRYRRKMEDVCVAIPQFQLLDGDVASTSFFGVYDGHGGDFCARYAAENLHTRLAASIKQRMNHRRRMADDDILTDEDITHGLAQAFETVDHELARFDEAAESGSTAVACLVRQVHGRTTFYIANVGDSRAILFSNGATSRLSVDHKATNEDEARRIRARNGIILNKRVGGVLSVTRALGQSDEKELITADPHLSSGRVEVDGAFLMLVSDGVSDIYSDEELTQFVSRRLQLGEKASTICSTLLDEAKVRGAVDNMTAVLVCFSDVLPGSEQRRR
ncbi:hypothetical protein P43SY_001963 [Pythium insidiosum]|uniref:protein-serine/threonine phosphatase n=1 Tax=Pythium insidiosum TaxID=114742 RepID=A0AAD5LSX4_PYTIN|nr:hypothetical protein P43SY_001963 [Pythium insidiosum]